MVINKSLDESKIIAALLCDVHTLHGVVFNRRSLKLTLEKVDKRLREEGVGFLTKTLPRLGKCFDKALSGIHTMNREVHGWKTMDNSELPRFLGEFFNRVFQPNGALLPHPCTDSVRIIRQVLYLFYKYKLDYTDEQAQKVIATFEKTEQELSDSSAFFAEMRTTVENTPRCSRSVRSKIAKTGLLPHQVVREAQELLSELFRQFDPLDINPRHGPGVVATKQKLWAKFRWTNVSDRITCMYPFDAYFCASAGHVCDSYDRYHAIGNADLPAQVLLVPKDSRGPRLISCEPVDFQWIQQGLGRAIVRHVERHRLTEFNVNFTNQGPNRIGALLGSSTGRYATLDLNEASDRVHLELVRLLFPPRLCEYLEACRSLSTTLPDGRVIRLNKYAPMGSALCFPVLALTVWALLTAAAPDTDTREGILVYGDDVIVPTAYAANAMEQLELFGLKINRDKSCTGGLFRESCGMDAFNGACVTPVRLRTVWSSEPNPGVYTSWIAYANQFYDRRYYNLYNLIVNGTVDRLPRKRGSGEMSYRVQAVEGLHAIYGAIPSTDMHLACPSLVEVDESKRPKRRRNNTKLQKLQYLVNDVKSPSIVKYIDGWSMLLRYFSEGSKGPSLPCTDGSYSGVNHLIEVVDAFSSSMYTSRRASMLVRRWR